MWWVLSRLFGNKVSVFVRWLLLAVLPNVEIYNAGHVLVPCGFVLCVELTSGQGLSEIDEDLSVEADDEHLAGLCHDGKHANPTTQGQ